MSLRQERRGVSTPSHRIPRFFRFAIVGTLGAVIDFGLLNLLHGLLRWPLLIANVLSVSAAILSNYTWNRRWTFADAARQRTAPQLLRFILVSVVGLVLNTGVVVGLSELTERWFEPPWSYNLAKAVATGIVLVWNFAANRRWTFSTRLAGDR